MSNHNLNMYLPKEIPACHWNKYIYVCVCVCVRVNFVTSGDSNKRNFQHLFPRKLHGANLSRSSDLSHREKDIK